MKALLSSLFFFTIVVFLIPAAAAEKTLTLAVLVERRSLDEHDESSQKEIEEAIKYANEVFRKEIGTSLEIRHIEEVIPPDTIYHHYGPIMSILMLFPARQWLQKFSESREEDVVLFFISNRSSLYSQEMGKLLRGFQDEKRLFIGRSIFGIRIAADTTLHEVGHFCGGEHTEDKSSIMHKGVVGNTTYGDQKEIIKKNCG